MMSLRALTLAAAGLCVAGCGNGSKGSNDMAMAPDMAVVPLCGGADCTTMSSIKHLVVVIQENHTFDTYFGNYCTAATGSSPTCTTGPACCEAGPTMVSATAPTVNDDTDNSGLFNDRNHYHNCEVAEIDGGKMDHFVTGAATVDGNPCSAANNFAYVPATLAQPYYDLAAANALADRYFQPYAGQSSANDMYFARAQFVFVDNQYGPDAIGKNCPGLGGAPPVMQFTGTNLGDLLVAHGVAWAWYSQGFKVMKDANPQTAAQCPPAPSDCPAAIPKTPCDYDPSDNPFNYYDSTVDKTSTSRDYDADFASDLSAGKLPPVAFIKALGYKTEHPALGTITAGVAFVKGVVDAVAASPLAASTLVVFTYDEGGGFYDHVAPPATSSVDNQPYGTRVPMLAIGTFAKKNYVSHVTMEHSSVVKFIEWNWLGGATGQLMGRDATVNNLGDLLDASKTGTAVPSN
ncbi:MAG TPA: alkaline phosphatase family protein [Polyangia bacterium]